MQATRRKAEMLEQELGHERGCGGRASEQGIHISNTGQRECGVSGAVPEMGTWEEEQVGRTHRLGTFCEVELMGFLGQGGRGVHRTVPGVHGAIH